MVGLTLRAFLLFFTSIFIYFGGRVSEVSRDSCDWLMRYVINLYLKLNLMADF